MRHNRAIAAIAAVELRRFLRDRSNIFFVFIFPLVLVLLIGSQFGGSGPTGRVAIAGDASALRAAISTQLEHDGVAVTYAAEPAVREQVARARTDVGLFVDQAGSAAYDKGLPVTVEMVPGSGANTPATIQRIRSALNAIRTQQGQVAALTSHGVTAADATAALAAARQSVTPSTVRVVDVNAVAQAFAGVGQFDVGAASELLLFVFLTSLAGASTLIQTRRNGVMERTLAAPVSTFQALTGQALGRFTIAIFQGVYIMAATAILFGVEWGTIWLALLILAVFSGVAAGGAMVIGALVDNEGAATGLGVGFGLVLAALGGGMAPLEIFPETLRTIAHVTPHAWAYDAFAQVQRHNGTLVDILPQLGVLAAMALLLLAIGTWALRRSLARAM